MIILALIASSILIAGIVSYVDISEAAVIYDPLSRSIVGVVYGPAYFIKAPWQGVKIVYLRVETVDMFKNPPRDYPEVQAITRDGATVYIDITVRYQVQRNDEAIKILVTRYPLLDFEESVIVPIVRETVRNVIARYKLTEVIERREKVRGVIVQEVEARLREDPTVKGCLQIIDVAVRNIDFPEAIKRAIELKLAAQQEALAAEYKRQKLLIEANASAAARILEAEGEARAQIIRALAQANATLIQAEAQRRAIALIIQAYNRSDYAIIYYYIAALERIGEKGNLVIIVPQGQSVPLMMPLTPLKGEEHKTSP
ncbi:MAG: hypothetical protein DRJ59_03805 [Thermoprotei archaeon]|nr:MAG: hypothetical protein DRJ59_03805 [Thermoprotei archaeon]